MTPSEFKAWFDGFTEAMDKAPNEKQWKRIKERVKAIDGKPVTPIVIHDYWPTYPRRLYGQGDGMWWATYNADSTGGRPHGLSGGVYTANAAQKHDHDDRVAHGQALVGVGDNVYAFNGEGAMYALGKADAETV